MAACGLFDTSAGLSVDKLRPPRNPRSPINTSQRHEQPGNKISPALHFKWDESIALRRRTHPVDNTESERRIGCVDTNNIYIYIYLSLCRSRVNLFEKQMPFTMAYIYSNRVTSIFTCRVRKRERRRASLKFDLMRQGKSNDCRYQSLYKRKWHLFVSPSHFERKQVIGARTRQTCVTSRWVA